MKIWYQMVSSETGMKNFIAASQKLCDRAASPGTSVEVRGTTQGALGDQYRLFWHYDIREVLENGLKIRKSGGYDAFVIANSLDTALVELREALDIPVISHMEVCCFTACMMGAKFGIITPNERMIPRYREIPYGYGLADRVAAVEALEFDNIRGLDEIFTDDATGDACVKQVEVASDRCIDAGAETIIVAGPASTLLAQRGIFSYRDVPLLDCYTLLVKHAESMVAMHRLTGVCVSRKLMYQAPSADMVARVADVRGIDLLREND